MTLSNFSIHPWSTSPCSASRGRHPVSRTARRGPQRTMATSSSRVECRYPA